MDSMVCHHLAAAPVAAAASVAAAADPPAAAAELQCDVHAMLPAEGRAAVV